VEKVVAESRSGGDSGHKLQVKEVEVVVASEGSGGRGNGE